MDLIELTEAFLAAKYHAFSPTLAALTATIWWPVRGCLRRSLLLGLSVVNFVGGPNRPCKRYGNKPVYVLTSRKTASAAKEFGYDLKNLKRAVLIGETTAGGAHPFETYRIHPHFDAIIPTWRAINPVTGTNWEGTGVIPDIAVPQGDALKVAQIEAAQKILESLGGASTKADKALMKEVQLLIKGLISIEDEGE